MASSRNRSRKALAVGLAAIGVAGLSLATAAQLGVVSSDVVAGTDALIDCDSDGVTVSYTPAYSASIPGYQVASVTINDMDGTCTGTVYVTVANASDVSLASGSAAYAPSGGSQTITLSTPVSVASIYRVAVAIG